MVCYSVYMYTLFLSAVSSLPLREVYSFDLGWRTAASTPSPCDEYSAPLVDIVCDKVTYFTNITSEAACQAVACAKAVPLWQFCNGTSGCGAASCGVGVASQCRREPGLGWVGAMRNASYSGPPADAPEAQPGFDDSLWPVVDAPHDAIISGNYSRAQDPNWAFLPEQQYWYRKHFSLPAAWQGAAIMLEIDGQLTWNRTAVCFVANCPCRASRGQEFCQRRVFGSMASVSHLQSRTATCLCSSAWMPSRWP
jgi:hypothetical protein